MKLRATIVHIHEILWRKVRELWIRGNEKHRKMKVYERREEDGKTSERRKYKGK